MSSNSKEFEPLIIGFTCNWCSYRAADMAGISRIKYPANVRLIRLMCSGRLDPEFVLKALAGGADGVLITGCHPGECHYLEQNFKAYRRFRLLQRTIEQFGIEPGRVKLVWASAAEGVRFAEETAKMVEEIRKLGPLNWSSVVQEIGDHPLIQMDGATEALAVEDAEVESLQAEEVPA
jgi:F420-non-reducing hydrogenase iron-sulfur subunit